MATYRHWTVSIAPRPRWCHTLSIIGSPTQGIHPLRVTPNLGSGSSFWNSGAFVILLRPLVRLSSVSCRTTDVINAMRLSQLVDNADHWTLFTAFDRSVWDLGTCGLSFCLGLEGPGFGLDGWGLGLKSLALTTLLVTRRHHGNKYASLPTGLTNSAIGVDLALDNIHSIVTLTDKKLDNSHRYLTEKLNCTLSNTCHSINNNNYIEKLQIV